MSWVEAQRGLNEAQIGVCYELKKRVRPDMISFIGAKWIMLIKVRYGPPRYVATSTKHS